MKNFSYFREETKKNGFYVIYHKGTERNIVSGPHTHKEAHKMRQSQSKNGMYFGLNQDYDLLYFDGKQFKHTHHETTMPIDKNIYSADPSKKLHRAIKDRS